jgi:hypothetical protein
MKLLELSKDERRTLREMRIFHPRRMMVIGKCAQWEERRSLRSARRKQIVKYH